jgi:hypothetical protein
MIELRLQSPSWEGLEAQLRVGLARVESVRGQIGMGGGGNVAVPDQASRLRELKSKLSGKQQQLVERLKNGKASTRELTALLGSIAAVRGVTARLSSLAKGCGLSYGEVITRDYSKWNTIHALEMGLTAEARAVFA